MMTAKIGLDELREALQTNPALEEVTGRQWDALKALVEFRLKNGQFPTSRELGEVLGISSVRVQQLFKELGTKGFVTHTGKRRGLLVSDKGIEYYAHREGLGIQGQSSLF